MLPLLLVMGTLDFVVLYSTHRFVHRWLKRVSIYVLYVGILGLVASEACYSQSKLLDVLGWNYRIAFDYSFMGILLVVPIAAVLIIRETMTSSRKNMMALHEGTKQLQQKLGWKRIRKVQQSNILSNSIQGKTIHLKINSEPIEPNAFLLPSNRLPKQKTFRLILRNQYSQQKIYRSAPKIQMHHHDFDMTFQMESTAPLAQVRQLLSVQACESLVKLVTAQHNNLDIAVLIEKQTLKVYIPKQFFFENIDMIKQYMVLAIDLLDILEQQQSIQTHG